MSTPLCLCIDVNWGSSTQAQTYKNALLSVHQLNRVDDHVKNYCPQILVLSGSPNSRPPLVDFGYLITKNISLLICGNISEVSLSFKHMCNCYIILICYFPFFIKLALYFSSKPSFPLLQFNLL